MLRRERVADALERKRDILGEGRVGRRGLAVELERLRIVLPRAREITFADPHISPSLQNVGDVDLGPSGGRVGSREALGDAQRLVVGRQGAQEVGLGNLQPSQPVESDHQVMLRRRRVGIDRGQLTVDRRFLLGIDLGADKVALRDQPIA